MTSLRRQAIPLSIHRFHRLAQIFPDLLFTPEGIFLNRCNLWIHGSVLSAVGGFGLVVKRLYSRDFAPKLTSSPVSRPVAFR